MTTEKERLEALSKSVKYKIEILNEIEKRLIQMRSHAYTAAKAETLQKEREMIQQEVNQLVEEIKLLEQPSTRLS